MSDALINKERDILYASFEDSLPEPQWNGLFIKPINSRVSSDFGKKRTVNGRPWGQHGGIDLAGTTGTPIKAPAGGRVVLAQKLWIRGNTIVLDHGMGLFTMYNHLSRFQVKEGDLVQPGQTLGNVGSTGLASGPHLHFEARVNKISVNPWILLKKGLLVDQK